MFIWEAVSLFNHSLITPAKWGAITEKIVQCGQQACRRGKWVMACKQIVSQAGALWWREMRTSTMWMSPSAIMPYLLIWMLVRLSTSQALIRHLPIIITPVWTEQWLHTAVTEGEQIVHCSMAMLFLSFSFLLLKWREKCSCLLIYTKKNTVVGPEFKVQLEQPQGFKLWECVERTFECTIIIVRPVLVSEFWTLLYTCTLKNTARLWRSYEYTKRKYVST